MYQLKLSRSVSYTAENFEEILQDAKKNGFEAVDLDLCGHRKYPDEEMDLIKATAADRAKAIAACGMTINGVHISFGRTWDFSSPDEAVRVKAVAKLKEIFPVLDPFSPVCYVIHGSYEPIMNKDRAAHIEALKQSLRELIPDTKTPIAVETLPRTCLLNTAEETCAIIDAVPNARVCIDVNHFLQNPSHDEVAEIGERAITTHISDHDYLTERHWMPGQGKIDWMLLLEAFEKSGYRGAFNYEVSLETASCKEIKENYDDIFNRYNQR